MKPRIRNDMAASRLERRARNCPPRTCHPRLYQSAFRRKIVLNECIALFSTVEREGQLSGKPTRPSTSYRQPARASSGDAPAHAVLSGLHNRSEGVRLIAAPISATPSVAVAAPRQFAFLKLYGRIVRH